MTGSYKHGNDVKEGDRLVHQFASDWHAWEKDTLAELGIEPDTERKSALSYGCGIGIDAATLLEEGYATYVEGWDSSIDSINRAQKQFGKEQLVFRNIDLLTGSPPASIPSFDLIYLRLVLQHTTFKNVPRLLEMCRDLLSNGGYLVVNDVDRIKEIVVPENHEFNLICCKIREYLFRCGNHPAIGSLTLRFFQELGFRNVNSRTVTREWNFLETQEHLSFSTNVVDDTQPGGRLISQFLWESACKNDSANFKRMCHRVITVGQK